MLTLKEWLSLHGKEDCCGCEYNNPVKARCSYKAGFCIRYDLYRKRQNGTPPEQLSLFE